MQDTIIWNRVLNHLAGTEAPEEKEQFITWLAESKENELLFNKVKNIWNLEELHSPVTFLGRFTKQKIKSFILQQAIGNLIGFTAGMWVTALFSHHVLERRGLKNLFGLTGRKQLVVNEIPEWMQSGIAILVGFIALELVNYFFQEKKHMLIWHYLKGTSN